MGVKGDWGIAVSSAFFAERKGKVIVAHKSMATRSCIMDIVRGEGFQVEGSDTCKNVLSRLEVENFDWVIVPIDTEEPVNGFHILHVLGQVPERSNVQVSFLLDEEQIVDLLPLAFELGLLGWFVAGESKEVQSEKFRKMFEQLELFQYDTLLYAANLLRQILEKKLDFKNILILCENLAKACPSSEYALCWLAEAYFLNGKLDDGRKLISKIKAFDPELCLPIEAKYVANADVSNPDLGIKSVVFVDSDEIVQKSLQDLLAKVGVTDIRCFSDPMLASSAIDTHPPDLIIMEWKLPILSGANFIQRIRSKGHNDVPIVILSSLVKKNDIFLLNEMLVANVIEKPFRGDDVLKALAWTVLQEKNPTQRRYLEKKMAALLLKGQKEDALRYRKKLESDASYPQPSRQYTAALFYYYSGDYSAARSELTKAISAGVDLLPALGLMGKCCMKLRDFTSAIKFLARAQEYSPQNIGRMAELAESYAEAGDLGAANEVLDRARDQDLGSKVVMTAQAKVDIMTGKTEKAMSILQAIGTPESLVADLNNSAVAQVRTGDLKKGLELYTHTLSAIPSSEVVLRERVLYNMSLAHLRSNRLDDGKSILVKIGNTQNPLLSKKVAQILRRVESAIREDRLLDFDRMNAEAFEEMGVKKTPLPGDLGVLASMAVAKRNLQTLFALPEKERTYSKALLKSPPRFVLRQAIVREETPSEYSSERKTFKKN
jgi:DNA-binding response OmpR family regulator